MFENGQIIHIENYEFDNGDIKNTGKFLIVILNQEGKTIIASLTSSQNYVPDNLKKTGCVNDKTKQISCYFFPKSINITANNFFFPKDTFIYFHHNVFKKEINHLLKKYQNKITEKGKLIDKQYQDLIYCIYKSQFTKRGIRRILEKHLEEIMS